jgi:hypothetical protein
VDGEAIELGEIEGWEDDKRGLRFSECAEDAYCVAGVE